MTDPIPNTLAELGLVLEQNDLISRTIDGRQFFMASISDPGTGTSLIFASPTFLPLLNDGNDKELHIDGTFKVRPLTPPSRQLLTVMSMHFKRVS